MTLTPIAIRSVFLVFCLFLAGTTGSPVPGINWRHQTGVTPDDKTLENLLTAYKGEMTAYAKYTAFAKKAHEEGYDRIALLFAAISRSELIHANNHRRVLFDFGILTPPLQSDFLVKSTKENLQNAYAGESYEAYTMYPDFIMTANSAGNQPALVTFNYACKTEIRHKLLYEKALVSLILHDEKTLPETYYICQICGMTYPMNAPSRCILCLTYNGKFLKVDKF